MTQKRPLPFFFSPPGCALRLALGRAFAVPAAEHFVDGPEGSSPDIMHGQAAVLWNASALQR